jgi:L-ornithine Nalpha-acyltransferase
MGERKLLAHAGDLEVRLAETSREIIAAQALRYRVFFEEGGAAPDEASRLARRDICPFDEVCDHVLAVDSRTGEVVGAYRLLRREVADLRFGFYSSAEFEVGALIARHPGLNFMELGRSCVAEGYRARRTLETLWRGVWAYALAHRIDVMFGCASFPGADPRAHAAALAALASQCAAEPEWRVAPSPRARAVAAPTVAPDGLKDALRGLPPLVKGYLRLGARFGTEAVVDEAFGATDVFVVLRVADIQARYLHHFAPVEPIAA